MLGMITPAILHPTPASRVQERATICVGQQSLHLTSGLRLRHSRMEGCRNWFFTWQIQRWIAVDDIDSLGLGFRLPGAGIQND